MKMTVKTKLHESARLSVAPMMAWTDRHCRHFHRLMSQETLLYTEMVTAPALVLGGAVRLLDFNAEEQPLALQLGGSDPAELAKATALGASYGYREINLNLGCPSDRVQSGSFGAILMTQPDLVFSCLQEMQAASDVEVTVKCRIGVDDQEPRDILPKFIEMVQSSGINRVIIHARKAWLNGLSPKENRNIPPLDYSLVYQIKHEFPDLHISLNGGVIDIESARDALDLGMDGVMIGRAAYQTPFEILSRADALIYGSKSGPDADVIAEQMISYIERHLQSGGRLHQVTRHMFGLFSGKPGARFWRRGLSALGAQKSATALDYQTLLKELSKISDKRPKFEVK